MRYKYCAEGHVMDPSWKYCPVCLAPLAGWFVSLDEQGKSRKFYTIHEGKSYIGSGADCELRILHEGLCRQQAYLTIENGDCSIVDLGNGEQMHVNKAGAVKATLIDGDVITFGKSEFRIKLL